LSGDRPGSPAAWLLAADAVVRRPGGWKFRGACVSSTRTWTAGWWVRFRYAGRISCGLGFVLAAATAGRA